MRLGQLARKLDKKPQELVDFLKESHQITLDSDLNTKIEGEALKLVMESFEVTTAEMQVEDNPVSTEPEIVEEIETEKEVELTEEEIEQLAAEAVASEIELEEDESPENEKNVEKIIRLSEDGEELPELIVEDGVIKAPKPAIDGPKVLGKIELPTVKRSVNFFITKGEETLDVTEAIHEKRQAERQARKQAAIEARKNRKRKSDKKPKRRVLSENEKKQQEKKIQAAKQVAIEKKKQEKRKQHYYENVQKKTIKSSKQKKKKEIEKAIKKHKPTKQTPAPTTLWGKFKRWLNT